MITRKDISIERCIQWGEKGEDTTIYGKLELRRSARISHEELTKCADTEALLRDRENKILAVIIEKLYGDIEDSIHNLRSDHFVDPGVYEALGKILMMIATSKSNTISNTISFDDPMEVMAADNKALASIRGPSKGMSRIFMKYGGGAWFCGSIKDTYWALREGDATEFPTQEAIDIISELRKDKDIGEIELVISNEKK